MDTAMCRFSGGQTSAIMKRAVLCSPEMPNPIAVSNADIAFDGTQVLDLKPYTPSIDRIENPRTPNWCGH